MAYTRTSWENDPSTATPINAARLNNLESGVAAAHAQLDGRLSEDQLSATLARVGTRPDLPAYNVAPTNLAWWRIHLAHAKFGQRAARFMAIGDSTTQGSETVQQSWPTFLIDELTARGVPCRPGIVVASSNIADDRWHAVGWTHAQAVGPAGGTFYASGDDPDATLYHSSKIMADRSDIWYLVHDAGGESIVEIGGTTLATIDHAGGPADTYQKVTISYAPGDDVTFAIHAPSGGSAYILGVESYLSTDDPALVTVANWGQSGATTLDWTTDYSSLGAVSSVQPDLAAVMLGINDAIGSVPVADYIARIGQIATAVRGYGGTVLLCSFAPSNPAFMTGIGPREQAYVDALREYAAAEAVPFFDLFARFGEWSGLASGWWRDDVHPSSAANHDIAAAIAQILV